MSRLILNFAFILTVACLVILLSATLIKSRNIAEDQTIRSTYVVHMDKSRMPKSFTTHQQWYSSIVESLNTDHQKPNKPSLLYSYDHAAHGFSATLTPQELDRLKKTPGFLVASGDRTCSLDTTYTPEYISLNPSSGLWPASNFGEDVVIGVVDSGIWPESKSFKDDNISWVPPAKWSGTCQPGQDDFDASACNYKLIGARFFNRGAIAANPGISAAEFNSTRDTIGHGTATASVAAGNYVERASYFGYGRGTAKGVAPLARIAAYKVSWGRDKTYASDVLAGMDQAIADGVDVILVPIGCDGAKIYEDPVAIASFAAMEMGIVVSSSAGNHLAAPHNAIPWVITAAAGTVERRFGGTIYITDYLNITGFSLYPENALIQHGLYLNETDAEASCNSTQLLRTGVPRGSIILCADETVPIRDQLSTLSQVSDHLSAAIIIRPNMSDLEESFCQFTFPAVVVSPQVAPVLSYGHGFKEIVRSLKELASAPYKRTPYWQTQTPSFIKFQDTVYNTVATPAASFLTARTAGPLPYHPVMLKPDMMAPGVHVIAAWPPNLPAARIGTQYAPLGGDFAVMSGTSIAAAHVAGVAALLKAAHPDWSPAAVRSALMTTAKAKDKNGRPIWDNADEFNSGEKPATPLTIGSGQIDADRALDPGLVYDISPQEYVDTLCNDFVDLSEEEIRAIVRSDFVCDFTSDQLNYPAFVLVHRGSASVRTRARFVRTVTNVGMGPATYKAEVTAQKNLTVTVMPETLEFQESGERKSYRVDVTFTRELEDVVFGELVWAEQNGSHTVRSPIVTAARGNQTPLNSVRTRRYESAATL